MSNKKDARLKWVKESNRSVSKSVKSKRGSTRFFFFLNPSIQPKLFDVARLVPIFVQLDLIV